MRTKIAKVKNHIYRNRAKYTAVVTIPTTIIVMNHHYKPYVLVARDMAVFLHDHDLGTKFLKTVSQAKVS
jgi:hypothetical protein